MSYKLLGARMKIEDLEAFKAKCATLGITQASIVNHLLNQWTQFGDAYAVVVPGMVGLALLHLVEVLSPGIGGEADWTDTPMGEVPEVEPPSELLPYIKARPVFEPVRERVPA